jgi:CSLREA domain-containing protein
MLHVVRELKAVGAVLALLAGAALTGPARAATITVTTTADELDTNGTCSLREAIRAANLDVAVDACAAGAGADEIVLPAGVYQLAIPGPAEDAALTGDLDITGDLVITGAGAASTIIDGGGLDRVFHVDPRGDRIAVTIRGVTIQNGRVSPISFVAATGGGVLLGATNTLGGTIPSGSLTLGESIVRGSTAAGTGGGVANRGGTLTLVDTTIRDNTASTGGGIYNGQSSTTHLLRSTVRDNGAVAEFSSGGGGIFSGGDELTVVDSTISGNIVNTTTGTQGGGIAVYAGVLHLLNATVSGNRTGPPSGRQGGSGGGGIYVQGGGAHTIASSTITDNAATGTAGAGVGGGGIFKYPGTQGIVTLANTILAGNRAIAGGAPAGGPDCASDAGRMRSAGYNLIGNGAGCNFARAATDRVGTPAAPIDPLLGPLADNGGPTQTHALLAGSPAIDAANPAAPGSGGDACPATDQRGTHRLEDGNGDGIARCDIGAFELAAPAAALSLAGIRPAHAGNAGTATTLVYGSGFAAGATVELRRENLPAIVGQPAQVGARGAIITAVFDLAGRPAGAWNLVVTNPDGTAVRLPGAFVVEEGGRARPSVEILGRLQPRVGRPAVYQLLVTNEGDVDAFGVPVMIGIPAPLDFRVRFAITPPPEHEGQPPTDWSQIPVAIDGEVTTLPLVLPVVPAGFTGVLELTLTPPPQTLGREIVLVGGTDAPYVLPDRRPQIPPDFIAGARAYAARALGVAIPPDLEPALEQYAAEQLARVVEDGRSAWVASGGTQPQVYALSQLLIDVAQRGAVLAGQSARLVPADADLAARLTRWIVASAGALLRIAPAWAAGGSAAECREMGWKVIGNACVPKQCTGVPVGFKGGGDGCGGFPIGPVGAHDPNQKVGSPGVDAAHFDPAAGPFPYVVFFENVETASAPAAEVVVSDQLDAGSLDLDTFSLGPISFGDTTVVPPPGSTAFRTHVDLRPARNLLVRIEATFDKPTALVTWRFTSLDPDTLEPPEDPLAGFLPPNLHPPEGEGRVTFFVAARADTATGTDVCNQATIVFDANPPISTETWCNRVDTTPPTSRVDLVSRACSGAIALRWSGTDEGAGVDSYDVFVSENGGPATVWLHDTPEGSGIFPGSPGTTYAFYSVARDRVGNVEAPPPVPDVVVRPAPGCCRSDADCVGADVCSGRATCNIATGTCVDGAPLVCDDDADPCTSDACAPGVGCVHTPITPCPAACAADCRSDDPCVVAECVAGRCERTDRLGVAGARCACDRPPPAACAGESVPERIARRTRAACRALDRAAAATKAKPRRKLLMQAIRSWQAAAAALEHRAAKTLSPRCRAALAASYADAASRAKVSRSPSR